MSNLELFGTYRGTDEDSLNRIIELFETKTGHSVNYVGSANFADEIIDFALEENLPDIAIFPQPGLLLDLAALGFIQPLKKNTQIWVSENYASGDSWNDLVSLETNGETTLYGYFFNTNMKSLVWYSPKRFGQLGLEIPKTLEELESLTDDISNSGLIPWAMPFGSGGATGWPGTDWIEDLVIANNSVEIYNSWVVGDTKFQSNEILESLNQFKKFGEQSGYDDNPTYLAQNNFWDGIELIASDLGSNTTPLLLHSAFMASFAPDNLVYGEDYSYFDFPVSASSESFMRVGGTSFAIMKDSDSELAQDFIEFLQDPEIHKVWLAEGGFLTPLEISSEDLSELSPLISDLQTDFQELGDRNIVFDGSDMMPPEIGANLFWTEMADFFSSTPEEVGSKIDNSFPEINSYVGTSAVIRFGGITDDIISGLEGDDILVSGGGRDFIKGEGGNDTIVISSESTFSFNSVAFNISSSFQIGTGERINLNDKHRFESVIDGGEDADTIQLSNDAEALFLHDNFSGFNTSLSLSDDFSNRPGTARINKIEVIYAADGDDIVDLTSPDYSLAGQQITVHGGMGDDIIWGSDADEFILGGEHDDVLFGGAGKNFLIGGSGADEFQFTKTSTNDTVEDFDKNEGDVLKFFNSTGVNFDRSSVTLNSNELSISYGADILTILLTNADLTLDDLTPDSLIII